jgi:molecular chaperone DnaK (HSP70)
LEFAAAGQAHSLPLARAELEALLELNGFYAAIRHVVDKVMYVARRRGIFKEDINYVLLVGGVSLMPSVQRTLRQYFTQQAIRADKPFTAVAEGALQVAAGFGLDDYLVHSYGLRHLDPETGEHHYDEIIPMGSPYPILEPIEVLLGAAHPGQREVEFVIGEIDTEAISMLEVKYEDGQAVFVARADASNQQIVPLNEAEALKFLARLDPPGAPSEDRFKAEFTVDDRRRLRLNATDLRTGTQLLHNIVVATIR